MCTRELEVVKRRSEIKLTIDPNDHNFHSSQKINLEKLETGYDLSVYWLTRVFQVLNEQLNTY
jgi:hypothetical protein